MENDKEEFEKVCKPVIEYLCKYYHPHCTVIIDCGHAELLEGQMAFHTEEFIKD